MEIVREFEKSSRPETSYSTTTAIFKWDLTWIFCDDQFCASNCLENNTFPGLDLILSSQPHKMEYIHVWKTYLLGGRGPECGRVFPPPPNRRMFCIIARGSAGQQQNYGETHPFGHPVRGRTSYPVYSDKAAPKRGHVIRNKTGFTELLEFYAKNLGNKKILTRKWRSGQSTGRLLPMDLDGTHVAGRFFLRRVSKT